ncbi:MAG: histidine triad nucleotide-binding protein [Campylobacteraceae bacterium]|jgi:histidine triad (HIT) family protein|nr:histidine triad nucleotide-binding protein [Campylobacteraceae bacterium]
MTVFTKIIKGELPSDKVLENDHFLAFHDINPKAPIHILIIPKEEVKDFQSVSGRLMSEMTLFMQEVAKLMGLDKSGYRLVVNNGKDSGQEVMHLHFHMMGGSKLIWPHLADTDTKNFF